MKTEPSFKMNSNWVVVADEAKAIIYAQNTKREPLYEVLSLQNEHAQKKGAELNSDREGRSFESHGLGRHSMTNEKQDSKKHAATIFAKKVVEHITKAKHAHHCRDYALIAAPKFLGLLRDALDIAGTPKPYLSINKEVVGQDTIVIQKLLDDQKKLTS